jgi:hypothetical protein
MLAFNNSILLGSKDTIGTMDDSFVRIKGWSSEFKAIVTTNNFNLVKNFLWAKAC